MRKVWNFLVRLYWRVIDRLFHVTRGKKVPGAARGRVYVRKNDTDRPSGMRTKAEPTVTLSAVVTRADGTIEDLGVIARSSNT